MTFFQRFKTPFTENAADDQVRLQPRMRMVGELLQERREDLGLDLEEIGAMLRIKPAYLAALEQGRSRDLPGPAYAIGFVRAYADFLGLDADQVLVRFKAEASGVTAKPDLTLPVPLGERSLPGGALVLVALIVALCGYGIWYYLSTGERDRPQRVAAVPAALQTAPVAPVLVSPPDAAVQSSAPNPAPASGSAPPAPPAFYGAAANPANAPPAPAPAAAQPPVATTGGIPPGATRITAPAAPTQPSTPPAAVPVSNTPARAAAVTAAAAPAQPSAARSPAASSPATPSADGVPGSAVRISIRALSDCWIQVRGPDQSIVFSRVLKSGEIYKVPSRSGLSLRTGNAGALEIAVDGKTAPSIGAIGTLRRDVALDPAALASGTAVHG